MHLVCFPQYAHRISIPRSNFCATVADARALSRHCERIGHVELGMST